MWLIFALLSALASTTRNIFQKRVLRRESAPEFALVFALFSAIISLPLLLFVDYASIPWSQFVGVYFFSALTGAVGFYVVAKSIKHLEISVVSPLLVMNPGVTAVIAYFFLNEHLSLNQFFGLLLLLIGAYALETKPHQKILDPIKNWISSKSIHLVFIALILYSISSSYDRYMFVNFDLSVLDYFAIVNLFVAINYIIIFFIFHKQKDGLNHGLKYYGKDLALVAFFDVLQRLTLMAAINMAFVSLALSVRRMSAIFTVIIGGEIYHEKNILRKTLSTAIMVAGAILVAF